MLVRSLSVVLFALLGGPMGRTLAEEPTAREVAFYGYTKAVELKLGKTRAVLCPQAGGRTSGSGRLLLVDDDAGVLRHAGVEVDHVLVHQADATGGDRLADRTPFRISVQAVERVLAVLENIERARAERVLQARLHAAVLDGVFRKLRLAGDHLVRRLPARPGLAPVDDAFALPGKALAADADAIVRFLKEGGSRRPIAASDSEGTHADREGDELGYRLGRAPA